MTAVQETRRRALGLKVTLAAAAIALAGCNAPVQVHGNMPEQEEIAKVRNGQDSRNDVVRALGSPSAISTFKDKTWYYIGSKKQQFAFFKPEVLERSILAVSFDDADRVASTEVYTLKDGRPVNPVDRVTPTEGKDLTLLQQLLGNLGRFNASEAGVSTTGPGTGIPGQP